MLKHTLLFCAAALLAGGVHAQTLDRIKSSGELRIGFRTDAPPLSYTDEAGNPAGYAPLVCAELAQGLANGLEMDNLEVSFLPVTAGDRFQKVVDGEIDLLCGAATITLRRREMVDFSVPVYVDGAAAMLRRGSSSNFAELAGQKIGVRADTTTSETLANTLRAMNIEADVVNVSDHNDGVEMMLSGELSAYFADQSILLGLDAIHDADDQLVVMDKLLTVEKQGLAMSRGDSDFRLAVDAIISEMISAGVLQDIFRKTLPGATEGLALRAMYLMSPTLE
jgi:polar amino acid transport system substrate-binding protein/glutamate/aspartate transport system substrate-binding protein